MTEEMVDKRKSLEVAMAALNKEFGKKSVYFFDDDIESVPAIPTGAFSLDTALGVGGVPRGRISEIFGPESSGKSTIAMSIVANVQKRGELAAYVDMEHAIDPGYATAIGVNFDDLAFSQPDHGEMAIDIVERLARTGSLSVIILDSVAALTPKAELEGSMEDQHMGLQPRMMAKAMRKLVPIANETGTAIIFINQIREKIGIMFGCVHGDTLVNFVDGTSVPISRVVNDRIQGNVWAYDEKTDTFVETPIVDWHINGQVESKEDWIHIQSRSINSKGGRFGITVTPDHEVYVPGGWVPASSLKVGDQLMSKYESIVNGTLADFLWGSFVGNSHIAVRSEQTACIKFQDSNDPRYLEWKIDKLTPFFDIKANGSRYETNYIYELSKIKKELDNRNPLIFLNNHYSDLGLAIWFMDDAHFDRRSPKSGAFRYMLSIKRLKNDEPILREIARWFEKRFGFLDKVSFNKEGTLTFNQEQSLAIAETIAPYVPHEMRHKIPVSLYPQFKDFELSSHKVTLSEPVEITQIRNGSDRQMRQPNKYDITVRDHANFMAGGKDNGVVVHNSPETTPGGRALRFAATVRIDLRRKDTLTDKDGNVTGIKVKAKIIKNKVGPPLREALFNIVYGEGVDFESSLVEAAIDRGVLEKSGSWIKFNGEAFAQGVNNAALKLKDEPETAKAIELAVWTVINPPPIVLETIAVPAEEGDHAENRL